MRTHQEIEARSLAMHRLIAERIRRDPALLARVRATLVRWLPEVSTRARPELEEWLRVVDRGLDATLALATEDSERAATLRQSSPFVGILTSRERFEFLREWKARHAA